MDCLLRFSIYSMRDALKKALNWILVATFLTCVCPNLAMANGAPQSSWFGSTCSAIMASLRIGPFGQRKVTAEEAFEKMVLILDGHHQGIQKITMTDLLEQMEPVTSTFGPSERIEFLRLWSQSGRSSNHWVGELIYQQVVQPTEPGLARRLPMAEFYNLIFDFDVELASRVVHFRDDLFPHFSSLEIRALTEHFAVAHPSIIHHYGGFLPVDNNLVTMSYETTIYAINGGRFVVNQSSFGRDGNRDSIFHGDPKYSPVRIPRSSEARLVREAFANDAYLTMLIGAFKDIPPIDESFPTFADGDEPSVQKALYVIADTYPEIVARSEIDLMWDRVQSREVGFQILTNLVNHLQAGGQLPETSLHLLSDVVGYDQELVTGLTVSSRYLTTLYELSFDIAKNVEGQTFAGFQVESALWQEKQLKSWLALLANLRDLMHIYGNDQVAWERVKAEVFEDKVISLDNAQSLIERSKQKIAAALEVVFAENNIRIQREQLDALYERWGSIEPIITLIARFQGSDSWRAEVSELGRVLESVLDNSFEDFKYLGDPDDPQDQAMASSQLESLKTPQQVSAWRANRSRLGLYDPSQFVVASEEKMAEAAKVIIDTNLLPNMNRQAIMNPLTTDLSAALLEHVLSGPNPKPPRVLARDLGVETNQIIDSLLFTLSTSTDFLTIKKVATYLRGNGMGTDLKPETMADLSSILAALKPPRAGSPAIVYTTSFDHPKMLITIGDLVDCASCQNYRTGGYIQTLLGYVIDAGVKGVVSYVLKPGHFANIKDYEVLQAHLKESPDASNVATHFDADKRVLSFRFVSSDGNAVDISSKPLSKGQMRLVLKLGATEGGEPGLFLERPYAQSSPAGAMMLNQVREITAEYNAEIGGVTGEDITVEASRNVGGVYSDAGGGINVYTYRLPWQSNYWNENPD
ncbi:MAG: hypothetical protein AAF202_00380 [Pseudomonadota bacterium]